MIDHLMLLTNSPSTGDTRNIILYITIAAIAALLIVVYIILGRKSKR